MNLEKVIFGFFIILACTLNFGFVIGDLDRIAGWLRVFGMVNSAAGFNRQPAVVNGFSDLVLELFGAETGAHAHSAIGIAELQFDIPVEIEAELELH